MMIVRRTIEPSLMERVAAKRSLSPRLPAALRIGVTLIELRNHSCPPRYFSSPAGTGMRSQFWRGGSGHVANDVKAQGGL